MNATAPRPTTTEARAKTVRAMDRARAVKAKEQLVLEAAITWVMGDSETDPDYDTEAALIEAVEALMQLRRLKSGAQ